MLKASPMTSLGKEREYFNHIKTGIEIFSDKNVQVTFGFEYEPGHKKMYLMSYANNKGKGADQPAHPRSLISAFVVRCLDSIISLDAIAEISRL